MLCYLREKCDVGFFQSMAGLMLSCRYVAMENSPPHLPRHDLPNVTKALCTD